MRNNENIRRWSRTKLVKHPVNTDSVRRRISFHWLCKGIAEPLQEHTSGKIKGICSVKSIDRVRNAYIIIWRKPICLYYSIKNGRYTFNRTGSVNRLSCGKHSGAGSSRNLILWSGDNFNIFRESKLPGKLSAERTDNSSVRYRLRHLFQTNSGRFQ